MLDYFSEIFSNHLLWFSVIFIYERFNLKVLLFLNVFQFLYYLMQMLQHIEIIYYHFNWWDLLLLLCFLSNRDNVYMVYYNSDLFHHICSTINEHDEIWNCYPLITMSMLSLFECIKRSLSVFLEDIKLIAIVDWVFHVSNFWRLFLIILRYGLILFRYSSIDNVLILSLSL